MKRILLIISILFSAFVAFSYDGNESAVINIACPYTFIQQKSTPDSFLLAGHSQESVSHFVKKKRKSRYVKGEIGELGPCFASLTEQVLFPNLSAGFYCTDLFYPEFNKLYTLRGPPFIVIIEA